MPKSTDIVDADGCGPHFEVRALKYIRSSQNCWGFWRKRLEGKLLRTVPHNLLEWMRTT